MNVVKMKVVIGSWLTLALIAGFSTNGISADQSHAGKEGSNNSSRPQVAQIPLPEQYDALRDALAKIPGNGFTMKEVVDLADAKKDVSVEIQNVEKLKKWEANFRKYRELLTGCAVNGDKSADVTGKLLDAFVKKLAEALTDDPAKTAAGLKEKHMVTFVTQIERVLKEKASIFSSSKADFEEADAKLVDQMKKTVAFFFGGYHGEQFDQLKQSADKWAEPFVADATAAIEALQARESGSLKVCKVSEEKPASETAAADQASPSPASPAPQTAKTEPAKDKEKPKLDPGPIEGSTPADTTTADGSSPQPGTEDPGAGTTDPSVGTPTVTAEDPNIPFIEPENNDVAADFDADALLRGVLDRFGQLEEQAKLDQDRAKQDLQNAVDQARRLGDDILRQQQAALDAQNNEDNGLADALKALTPQTPPPPPAPPAPPVTPPIIPPSDNGSQAQQPFFPPQQDDGGFQQPPPQQQMPFMPPPQQSSPPIIIGDDSNKWDEEYNRRPPVVVPQQNPQASGLLELVRLQQQLMFAQQQAQYGQVGPNGVRLNVNTMANRLAGGGSAPMANRRAVGNRAVQNNNGAVSGGRTTAPAALRGSLAK